MTTAVQHRRGTTAEHSTFTGLEGEVTIDTTKDTAVIHDGVLAGGYPLAKENLANVTTSGLSSIDGASTASDDKFFIYDQSATSLKTITRAELNNAMEQDALANVAITGGTINGTTIGGSTAAAASVTTLTTSSTVTHNGGTANGVAYLNGSKVLTTGSALTFDGTRFIVGSNMSAYGMLNVARDTNTPQATITLGDNATPANDVGIYFRQTSGVSGFSTAGAAFAWYNASPGTGELMRLTSTGLGIGTSSPAKKLHVNGDAQFNNTIYFTPSSGFAAIGASGTNVNIYNGSGAETRATFDNAGNLGLGVTPSAWTNYKAFEIGELGSAFLGISGSTVTTQNAYWQSGAWKYAANGYANRFEVGAGSGQFQWFTASNNTGGAGASLSFTQAMTLDASGNLGLGTTTLSTITGSMSTLSLGGTNATVSGGVAYQVNGTVKSYDYVESDVRKIQTVSGVPIAFLPAGTERARIDSSGNLLVGTTSQIGGAGERVHVRGNLIASNEYCILTGADTSSGVGYAMRMYSTNAAAVVGSITFSGTATAYNTSSDYRLKENIQPMTGALAKVQALKPCTYNWKADGSEGEGFIAHELAEVVPQCVTGEKDAVDAEGKPVYQGIDTSFLVATLTAAIQEQQAIIDQLKARLDAANL